MSRTGKIVQVVSLYYSVPVVFGGSSLSETYLVTNLKIEGGQSLYSHQRVASLNLLLLMGFANCFIAFFQRNVLCSNAVKCY